MTAAEGSGHPGPGERTDDGGVPLAEAETWLRYVSAQPGYFGSTRAARRLLVELRDLRADIAARQDEKEVQLFIMADYSDALRAMARRATSWRRTVRVLWAENARLRARTHEIQAQEMAKRAALDSEVAEWRRRYAEAEQWTESEGFKGGEHLSSSSWKLTSYNDRSALLRIVTEREQLRAECNRLRAELAALRELVSAVDPVVYTDASSPRLNRAFDGASAVLAAAEVPAERQDERECSCTGPPDYEGPCSWCDVHGQPSVAFQHGYDDGRRDTIELARADAPALAVPVVTCPHCLDEFTVEDIADGDVAVVCSMCAKAGRSPASTAPEDWCPECDTAPGGCEPGTCPGRPFPAREGPSTPAPVGAKVEDERVEWLFRQPGHPITQLYGEKQARRWKREFPDGVILRREVGPLIEVRDPADDDEETS